jgi:4'-phosphopantetheinyl transferase
MVTKQTLNDLGSDSIHIWRIDLDGPIGNLKDLLSMEEMERAQTKIAAKEQDRFVVARGSMRSILADYLGVAGEEIEFIHGEQGKPSVGYTSSNIEFNLTHCADMALLAVARATPVGIDLERIRTRPMQLKIARRMFSEEIFRELEQLPPEQQDATFFQHWTELEASAKCIGDGIFSYKQGDKSITTKHFTPQDGWIACVAANGKEISSMELKHFRYRI